MANRHLSRSIVLQTLFEGDFNGFDENVVKASLEKNLEEFAPGSDDNEFVHNLIETIVRKREIIDDVIEKAAPEWPLEKINPVDRNILRLGLSELLFADRKDVPPKVAINEAIELAKSFGGDSSSRFINGVLGAVYKELGEPGKDDTAKKKEEVDLTKIPVDQKAGSVVFSRGKDGIMFAMVHDVFGYWTLSKGGVEEGETPEEAVIREVKEEINLDIKVLKQLGENEYIASHPERGKVRKHVFYFLSEAKYGPLKLESSGGLDDTKWFKPEELADLRVYDDVAGLLAESINLISKDEV
ncbi:transcription antitermination factor NusB [Candidatus Nomurabacteria bacterium]|nr:transcription antitermination factor NusB [Candidatus Nomurabacteria bacterium]USN94814.1 MAG: transcription antitermination factor NusB [Candidatus Nomurabacteria bacterium]